jgi:diguanylate cyclase (GGDEF)-like protein
MSGTRVLVAEDSLTVRGLIARILTRAGFHVSTAVDGLDAIVRCGVERPDILLVDMEMPGCSGFDVLRRIKSDPDLAGVEVMMLTATHDHHLPGLALAAGAADFVRKPCDPRELVERVLRVDRTRTEREELTARMTTDELTGLPNRRGMQASLDTLGLPAPRAVGVLMVDIDHFKHINDAYGHGVGDEVLRTVANRLRTAWPLFVVSRWGGEEFLAAGPARDAVELAEIAERLRDAIEALPVSTAEHTIAVTVSVGGAVVADGCSQTAAIDWADQALYTAKEGGRNRVVLWDDATRVEEAFPA